MKAGTSKAKGSKFERDIAKRLGLALFGDSDSFVRTPGSGALATIRSSLAAPFGGDIMQVKHFNTYTFPYSIECKHYKKFDLYNLLIRNEKSLEFKAWAQCIRDAGKAGIEPLLIYRQNSRPIYTVTKVQSGFSDFIEDNLDTDIFCIKGVFTDGTLRYIPFEAFEEAAVQFSLTNNTRTK